MSQGLARASEWLYHGVWAVLVRWFRVPAEPPTLPIMGGETIQAFRPSDGFLRYLKFQFWLVLGTIDVALLVVWLVILVAAPLIGVLVTPLALAIIVVPAILVYVAIHLRYDTTWYVLSDRSLRIRRGIWIIRETTITFENIQNVSVDQGPLQRWFGIADVLVQTAGGGGTASHGQESAAMLGGHNGLIEGIDNAPQIRDLIRSRLQRSSSAGLGDEAHDSRPEHKLGFSTEHLAVLREIRDAAKQLALR
jgi:membrane protein YdbS with pleckstrin-like domain